MATSSCTDRGSLSSVRSNNLPATTTHADARQALFGAPAAAATATAAAAGDNARSTSKKRPRDSLEDILGVDLNNDSSSGTSGAVDGDGTSSSSPLDLTGTSPLRALAAPLDFPVGLLALQSQLLPSAALAPAPAPSVPSPSAVAPPARKRRRRRSAGPNVGSNQSSVDTSASAAPSARTRSKRRSSKSKDKGASGKSGATMSSSVSNSGLFSNAGAVHGSAPAPSIPSARGGRGGGRGRRSRRQRYPRSFGGFGGGGGNDESEVFVLGDPSGGGGGFGRAALAFGGSASQQQSPQQSGVAYQFSDYGTWNDMLPHASQAIEAARIAGQTSVRLIAMNRPYSYDLTNMLQTNEQTQVQRPIRRVERDPPKPKSDAPKEDEQKMEDVSAADLWVRVKLSEDQIKTEQCSLCMEDFKENKDAGRLRDCSGHYFHTDCGLGMTTAEYVLDKKKCPVCAIFYGTLIGNCPDGIMRVRATPIPVPGHECDRAWEIQFNFPGGVQSDKHPNPGSQLHADSRVAYLPDTDEGREVLELFKRGWKQRLLYTVGYSQTRQIDGVIIYNGIHMKTQVSGGMHGYPDKGYLMRVKEEFAVKGILPPRKDDASDNANEEDDDRMVDIS